jgi:hypothetical protein
VKAPAACLATALMLVAAGCGDNGNGDGKKSSPKPSASSPETVIRAWADTLRRGNVGRAAAYFSLPAIIQNGTPPLRLTKRSEVIAFNASLPCGASLLRTSTAGRYTEAVFRLTERPGSGRCGSGTGQTARTAFVVRNGKIREWRRLRDAPARAPAPADPVV